MRRLVPLSVLLMALTAHAAGSDPELAVALSRGEHGEQQVRCGFWLEATPQQIWEVLSDYESLPRFAPSLSQSKLLTGREPGKTLTLEQRAVVRVLMFSRHVHLVLRVTEEPLTRLSFVDTALRDFRHYSGSWTLQAQGNRTYVTYELNAVPSFRVPRSVARSVMRDLAVEFVGSVREEIRRRNPAS